MGSVRKTKECWSVCLFFFCQSEKQNIFEALPNFTVANPIQKKHIYNLLSISNDSRFGTPKHVQNIRQLQENKHFSLSDTHIGFTVFMRTHPST